MTVQADNPVAFNPATSVEEDVPENKTENVSTKGGENLPENKTENVVTKGKSNTFSTSVEDVPEEAPLVDVPESETYSFEEIFDRTSRFIRKLEENQKNDEVLKGARALRTMFDTKYDVLSLDESIDDTSNLDHTKKRKLNSNIAVINLVKSFKSDDVNLDHTTEDRDGRDSFYLPNTIKKMFDILNNNPKIRVKRLRNRPKGPENLPTTTVFDCRRLNEKLKQKDYESAIFDVQQGFHRHMTLGRGNQENHEENQEHNQVKENHPQIHSSDEFPKKQVHSPEEREPEDEEPDLPFEMSLLLAKGMIDLVRFIAEKWFYDETDHIRQWMSQIILRSPDDLTCSDGPPWHIDERFYYLHGILSFLGATTKIIDIRDEVCENTSTICENTSTTGVVLPAYLYPDNNSIECNYYKGELCVLKTEKDKAKYNELKTFRDPKFFAMPEYRIILDHNRILDHIEHNTESVKFHPFTYPAYSEFSPIRKFCIQEHSCGPLRREFERRFTKYPKLTKKEVHRVLSPVLGRDFVCYSGAEDVGRESVHALSRAAIHQGPHKTEESMSRGRVSFLFAVFDW